MELKGSVTSSSSLDASTNRVLGHFRQLTLLLRWNLLSIYQHFMNSIFCWVSSSQKIIRDTDMAPPSKCDVTFSFSKMQTFHSHKTKNYSSVKSKKCHVTLLLTLSFGDTNVTAHVTKMLVKLTPCESRSCVEGCNRETGPESELRCSGTRWQVASAHPLARQWCR